MEDKFQDSRMDVSIHVTIEIGSVQGERVNRGVSVFVPLDILGRLEIGDIVQAATESAGDEFVAIVEDRLALERSQAEEREKFEEMMSVSPSNPSGAEALATAEKISDSIKKRRVL